MNENYIIEDLLVKYLLKEASENEIQQVEQWIAESEANKKHFEQLQHILNASEHLIATSSVKEEEATSVL